MYIEFNSVIKHGVRVTEWLPPVELPYPLSRSDPVPIVEPSILGFDETVRVCRSNRNVIVAELLLDTATTFSLGIVMKCLTE